MTRLLWDANLFLKLSLAAGVTLLAWLPRTPLPTLLIATAVVGLILLARIPGWRAYLKAAAMLMALVTLTWTVNLALGGAPTAQAFATGLRMAARAVATTGAFFVLVETTSPGAVMAACSALRLPPKVTLVVTLVLGLIPMLRAEFEHIADAQRARGLDVDKAPLFTRLRYALARGVPLMVQGVRMAHAISLSLSLYGFDLHCRRTTWRRVGLLVEPTLTPERPE